MVTKAASARVPLRKYADITTFEKVHLFSVLLVQLPLFLLSSTITRSFLSLTNRVSQPLRSYLRDSAMRFAMSRLNRAQMQYATQIGTRLGDRSLGVYKAWCERKGVEVLVDEIGGDDGSGVKAKLMWVGERKYNKVVMFFHGGALLFPLPPFSIEFMAFIGEELKGKGKDVGIVILNYSLVPDAAFPVPLIQAILAVQHLLSKGTHPSGLHIIGDSAGGNLIHQLASHILHPLDTTSYLASGSSGGPYPKVPRLNLPAPFAGLSLISPWLQISPSLEVGDEDDEADIITLEMERSWAEEVLHGVPEEWRAYLEGLYKGPEAHEYPSSGRYSNLARVTKRILVTAGGREFMRPSITRWCERVEKENAGNSSGKLDLKLVIEEGGVHDGPIFDFVFGAKYAKENNEMVGLLVEWFAQGY